MGRKKKDEINDLVPPDGCEGRPTVVIEVCGQSWRVLRHAVEAIPFDYMNALTSAPMRDSHLPWLCSSCGAVTEFHYSAWTSVVDILCEACREAGYDEPRHCTYCHQPLVPLLPLNIGGKLKMLMVCPLHHVYVVVDKEAQE